jgi:hypothetical protein
MREAATGLLAILDIEMNLHVKLCARWGLSPSDLEQTPPAVEMLAYSQAPSVSSSRTSAISIFTVFDRSSAGMTASESASRVVTLAAVQDPPGRSSSTSPDGVAVNSGGMAKMIRIPFNGNAFKPWGGNEIDLPQSRKRLAALLTQINTYAVGHLKLDSHR